jgi:hypothetical protein
MLDTVVPISSEKVEPQAILFGINFTQQFGPEASPLGGIYRAFKNRELHALTETLTQFSHPAETAPPGNILGVHIVTDHNQHRSPPEECRVPVQVAPQAARQQ